MTARTLQKAAAGLRRRPREAGCTRATKRCDFWNWGVEHVRPDCCTDHMREMLFFVEDLLTENGIEHWVDYGTLLGAVREGALIPWDEDVDLGIREREREAVEALAPQVTAAGFDLEVKRSRITIHYSAVNLLAVDVFVWREHDGVLTSSFDPALDWPGMHGRTRFPAGYLRVPEPVTLFGRRFPAPSPVHRFLAEHRYGPDYMIPTRPILEGALYPNMGPEDMTPAAKRLLERLAERQRRLDELTTRSRLSQFHFWRRFAQAGLPRSAPPDAFDEVASTIRPDEWTTHVTELVATNARLDHAIRELEEGSLRARARRAGRRLAR